MSNCYSKEELIEMGIKCGDNCLISKKASIYSPTTIEFGNDVRVDDFCILSGNIKICEMGEESYYEIDEPSDWLIIEKLLLERGWPLCKMSSA